MLSCAAPTPDPPPVVQDEGPHLLLITLDTVRADHLGWLGYGRSTTPALDAFAAQSVVYTHARTHAPWTKAAMATIWTSQLPVHHGVQLWPDQVSEDAIQLPEIVQQEGYQTWAVTSHNAFDPSQNAFHKGFGVFDQSVIEGRCPEDLQTADGVTDRALAALQTLDAGSDPWMLWVHYFDPHDTYFHHDDIIDFGPGWANAYDEEIAWTDHELARLLARVATRNDLVTAVVADHGEELGERGYWGHAETLYEEQLRVPLLLAAPELVPQVVHDPVSLIDLAPTLLSLLGVARPAAFQGTDLLPHPTPRVHFAETDLRERSTRSAMMGSLKVIRSLQGVELYDLEQDPLEQHDLAPSHPRELQSMRVILEEAYPVNTDG